jgi:hypothetical protein
MRKFVSSLVAVLLATSTAAPVHASGDDDVRGIVHLTVPYDIAGLPSSTTSVDVECFLANGPTWTEHGGRAATPTDWQFKHLANRAMTRRDAFTLVFRLRPYRLVPRPTLFRCELKVTARDDGNPSEFTARYGSRLVSGGPIGAGSREILPAIKGFKPNRIRVEGVLTDVAFIADEAQPGTETACPCGCDGNPSQGTSACTGGSPARTPSGPKNIGPIVGRNPDGSSVAPAPSPYAMPYVAPGQTVPAIYFRGAAAIGPAV